MLTADCFERMLNFNNPVDSKTSWQENWKILIYDNLSRDMVSTLFKVADLRRHGVTLHLNLHADRQPVQDAAAIYLVEPSIENIQRIARDCSSGLYDSMYLNWSSTISQDSLHSLACSVSQTDSFHRIVKVVDQYVNFVSLGHNLFTLGMHNSYMALNDPEVRDSDMERTIGSIVNSLFSVMVTLGVLPFIACPQGDAAGMVGEALNKKLSEHVRNTNNLFKDHAYSPNAHSRPVLIILDRSQDLSVNLQHAWTYEAMLHDILGMKLNKVTINEQVGDGSGRKKSSVYDLSVQDAFWVDNSGKPFPSVTDDIEDKLNTWKSEYDAIGAQGNVVSDMPQGGGIDALTRAAQLERELDNFFSLESAIVSGSVYNAKSALMQARREEEELRGAEEEEQVFGPDALGSPEDKLRLFVIYYLCNPSLSEADVAEYEGALSKLGVDMSLSSYLKYLKKMKALSSRAISMAKGSAGGGGGSLSLTDIMSQFKAGTETATGLLKSVAASVGGKKDLPVTRLVDSIMENRVGSEAENFMLLDPNIQHKSAQMSSNATRKPFREAIVFMVGSGNYIEYQDLQDYARRGGAGVGVKNVVYGSTELVTASEFLQQLNALGKKKFSSI
ncbi:Sec1 family domain-containing protein 1A [Guillardia theta CCMP2712]|uniref:Sec1 family domain-containing protein 1A n=1 Tax=Guillardia theta (strain CCMP2712) TaxID=905079 RepID=L1IFA1_GUITC|nr:Sec1 family domain-containing protein 1A [Guillardia theta CCMP2712]EKX34589.1 Sec1 family domain-containing protein 1A [Guillardia theta CCMP2712]|eukprot:XP_005821569.1 Sec1 family domain-containing protein 1A [Guillardia theta CCMP2712]